MFLTYLETVQTEKLKYLYKYSNYIYCVYQEFVLILIAEVVITLQYLNTNLFSLLSTYLIICYTVYHRRVKSQTFPEKNLLSHLIKAVVVSCKADIEKNSKFGDEVKTLGTSGTFFNFQIKHQDPGELWEL